MDLTFKSDADLEQMIRNHERTPGGQDRALYRDLLEERGRRSDAKQALKLDASLEHLKRTAIMQGCTNYGELAAASGIPWSQARQKMNGSGGHLDRLRSLPRPRPPLADGHLREP